jgi:hypothetical protein
MALSGTEEQQFMEASLAYQAGRKIVSDEEYDQLKRKLKVVELVLFLHTLKIYMLISNFFKQKLQLTGPY